MVRRVLQRAREGVGADVPLRAREVAAAARAASLPPVTVQVEQLTPQSAQRAGRFSIPVDWPDFNLVVKVAPVLAQHDSCEAGLVLASVPVIVCHEVRRGLMSRAEQEYEAAERRYRGHARPMSTVAAWGADVTLQQMSGDDWVFAVGAGRDVPVPAFVSSHLRALAYYSALQGLDAVGLRRWKSALEQVQTQVEVLDSVFGSPVGGQPREDVVDMTGEQALASRDRELAGAWCQQARLISASSARAYERTASAWLAGQPDLTQADPDRSPGGTREP